MTGIVLDLNRFNDVVRDRTESQQDRVPTGLSPKALSQSLEVPSKAFLRSIET